MLYLLRQNEWTKASYYLAQPRCPESILTRVNKENIINYMKDQNIIVINMNIYLW